MHRFLLLAAVAASLMTPVSAAAQGTDRARPTIVLVHGAFTESSSWNGVIARLARDGYPAIAADNPLRSVSGDAEHLSAILKSIPGPIVLVGHSYGGIVITEAAGHKANVKALVYVAGFAPDIGESAISLSGKFPGSTLGEALTAVATPEGDKDLFIETEKFHAQFAADVSEEQSNLMAATQRPVTQAALSEPARSVAWRARPSFVIYGSEDRNIPAAVMRFMAERAHAVRTVAVDGASHAVMVSHPDAVASLIEKRHRQNESASDHSLKSTPTTRQETDHEDRHNRRHWAYRCQDRG